MEQVPLIPEAISEEERDTYGRPLQVPNAGNGRPRGSHNHSRRFYEESLSPLERRALIRQTYKSAMEGNPYDRRTLLDRFWPKQRSAPIETDLPPTATVADIRQAMHAVLTRVTSGELTTDDGAALVSMYKDLLAAHSIENLLPGSGSASNGNEVRSELLDRINRVIEETRRKQLPAAAEAEDSAA